MKLHPSILLRIMIGLPLTTIQSPGQSTYEPYTFTTLVGVGAGSADGTGSAARFNHPSGVAVDGAGNVYVADTDNHTIRKVTQAGVVTTLAGLAGYAGSTDGMASAARFYHPSDVAVDSAGNVYVADSGNNMIRKMVLVGSNWLVSTLAGLAQLDANGNPLSGSADGTGSAAQFNNPRGVAVDSTGNVYVADTGNLTIRKVTPEGVATTLAGLAGSFGWSADEQFWDPIGVAVDSTGNVYVADHLPGAGEGRLRKVTPVGVVTTPGVRAAYEGGGVAVDSAGNVYVASCSHKAGTMCKVTPTGEVTSLNIAQFGTANGLAVDNTGNLYFSDSGNHTILKMTAAGVVTTLAGLAASPGSADGTGSAARLNSPIGVAVDNAGNLYVADYLNHTIRKVTSVGVVTTLAGLAGSSGSVDGTGSAARFSSPHGVAVDSAGNLYVADLSNQTIRKMMPVGTNWVVTTLAGLAQFDTNGTPVRGSVDGTGSAARFNGPIGVAVDSAGTVYVADPGNKTIRKVTPTGAVTTLAGLAGSSGSADGTGSAARFNSPIGVAVDNAGNLYVADYSDYTIRKVTPAGLVTTLAGLAGSSGSADGTGSTSRFDNPLAVAVDSAGNVYVGDGNTIRKVTPAGVVTTLAGLAGSGGGADGTGSAARFGYTSGVAVDTTGNVYVADYGNNTIRKGYPTLAITSSGPNFGFSGGQFGFNLTGPKEVLVVVEASTDLMNWLPVWTNTSAGALSFSDPQSGVYSNRIYRALTP